MFQNINSNEDGTFEIEFDGQEFTLTAEQAETIAAFINKKQGE